jgi:hypothetical protein
MTFDFQFLSAVSTCFEPCVELCVAVDTLPVLARLTQECVFYGAASNVSTATNGLTYGSTQVDTALKKYKANVMENLRKTK